MMSLSEAIRTIAFKVRTASCAGTACVNSFGDEQLAVDMLADKLLFEALRYSQVLPTAWNASHKLFRYSSLLERSCMFGLCESYVLLVPCICWPREVCICKSFVL